jgi:hypothetical protein
VEKRGRRISGRNRFTFSFSFPPFAPPVGLRGGNMEGVLSMAVNEGLAVGARCRASPNIFDEKNFLPLG